MFKAWSVGAECEPVFLFNNSGKSSNIFKIQFLFREVHGFGQERSMCGVWSRLLCVLFRKRDQEDRQGFLWSWLLFFSVHYHCPLFLAHVLSAGWWRDGLFPAFTFFYHFNWCSHQSTISYRNQVSFVFFSPEVDLFSSLFCSLTSACLKVCC